MPPSEDCWDIASPIGGDRGDRLPPSGSLRLYAADGVSICHGAAGRLVLIRRVLGLVLVGVGVLILVARAQQWADLLAGDDPLPGTRYTRSITDVVAVALVGFGAPMARGLGADQMGSPVSIGPFIVPRWAVVPAITVVGFVLLVVALTAFSVGG